EDHRRRAPVFAAVRLPEFDVDTFAGLHLVLDVVQDDRRGAVHDEPVLGPTGVSLVAQTLPRRDDDALYLVIEEFVVEHGERTPGTLVDLTTTTVFCYHRTFSAASTALRNSMARVIGPTPPSRGVIQPAPSLTSSATSLRSFLPCQLVPAPTTAA